MNKQYKDHNQYIRYLNEYHIILGINPMKPDVIIIGAGVSGTSASIKMAQEGLKVVLIDRGLPIGSKNLSGGVLWGNDLAEILPNWMDDAPIERFIINKKVGFLSERDATVFDFHFDSWKEKPYPGVSILRASFDDWLAKQAQEAGVAVLSGITVDELVFEDGKVVGVKQGNEELRAPITIIAEGVNPRLLLKHNLTYRKEETRYDYPDMMIGLKEVIQLDKSVLEERFLLEDNAGVAGEFILGNMNDSEVLAGGFFYTNKESLSIGVIVHLDSLSSEDRSYEVIEQFKKHPYIKRLLKDGISIEYGAKMVPEFGIKKMPDFYGDGYMVIGDAAGFVFSNGLVIQGMNYGIKSGILAAETAKEAITKSNFSSSTLSLYHKKLKKSYILKDFEKFKNVKKMTKNKRLFKTYPNAINDGFRNYLTENGEPKEHLIRYMLKSFRSSGAGIFTLIKDGLGARHL
ncbi:MAG: Electron transfer flavoprotein-ubiquinone oxidoreductase [Candidatus Heimdallarchaeota archaeon LC_2]|nr:MAG: Electron transfer flavoprotein-ubiquinone oxidoreductase [Candidatus Heimdallarchaeota archaeon LC_2]